MPKSTCGGSRDGGKAANTTFTVESLQSEAERGHPGDICELAAFTADLIVDVNACAAADRDRVREMPCLHYLFVTSAIHLGGRIHPKVCHSTHRAQVKAGNVRPFIAPDRPDCVGVCCRDVVLRW